MSRFIKAVVIISCILFFAGLLLAITSLALGANPDIVGDRLVGMGVSDMYFRGHERFYDRFSHDYDYDYDHDYDYDYDYDHDYDYDYDWDNDLALTAPLPPEALLPPEAPLQPTVGEYDITQLYFDFEAGDIIITRGEDFALIYGSSQARRYFYENIEGSTWTVGSRKNWSLFDFWRHNGDRLKLTVVLPADFVAERLDIYMGAGNMRADALRARDLYLEVGLGNCQINELLAENADLSVGLGNLEARGFHADDARLDVGVGAMKLRLSQPLDEYRCHLSVGLGNVVLGRNSYNGVAELSTGSGEAPYQMDINCGLGSITVQESAK